MLSGDDDELLVDRLKVGDSSTFERIYHRYKRPLFHVALRYLKDRALAEDALQEVFVKLWNHRQQLDETRSLDGFLFTSMKHHVLNVIRSEQNRIRIAALAQTDQTQSANFTEQEVVYQECNQRMKEGIRRLSDGKRQIFCLSVLEGYSHREIAAMLGLSEPTVRAQLSRSSQLVRQYLNRVISLLLAFFFLG